MRAGAAAVLILLAATASARAQDTPLGLRPDAACENCSTSPPRAAAREASLVPATAEAVLRITVNQEPKGDFIVLVAQDGDILVRQEDLRALDLGALPGPRIMVAGRAYVSLRAAPGLRYAFDERHLAVSVLVARERGPRQAFLAVPRRAYGAPLYPPPAGAFANYNLSAYGDSRKQLQNEALAAELGWHAGDYLLSSDGLLSRDETIGRTQATRLGTSVTLDRRESLQRIVIGDFATTGDALGSPLRLGGISFTKRYSLDPAVIRFPGQVFTGAVTLPSELLLYSNGVLVRRERVAPGSFELQNISPTSGMQITELVVRDVLGNEQRIVEPFYFSDALLRQGLDEYGIESGAERREFGTRSNDYGALGSSVFYRRGITRWLTLGARGEALERRRNFGPTATAAAGRLGLFSLALTASDDSGRRGSGLLIGHNYQTPRFSTSLALRAESRDYARAAAGADPLRRKRELAGSAWMPLPNGTLLSVTLLDTQPWDAQRQRAVSLTARHAIARDVRVALTVRNIAGTSAGNEIALSVGILFDALGDRATLSATTQRLVGGEAQSLQLFGGNPVAEGLSYRASWDRVDQAGERTELFSPTLQYNASRFSARAEYFDRGSQAPAAHQFNLAGGLASAGGYTRLTRPVVDSFGVVKVGDAAGVRVYASGQEVARTDGEGIALLPSVASNFENTISISGSDLPPGYIVPELRYFVVPAYRSGVYVDFKARRIQAIAGRLLRVAHGRRELLADTEVRWTVNDHVFELFAGRDGRFYVEDVPSGSYRLHVGAGPEACEILLAVPKSEEPVIDLGELECHGTP
jgi:outer membrane usher protein